MSDNICEYCRKSHDGTYGSRRFCSIRCYKKFSGSRLPIVMDYDPDNML